jgi:hypothetical protein
MAKASRHTSEVAAFSSTKRLSPSYVTWPVKYDGSSETCKWTCV